jgi:type I restriction enzyme, S subunit
MNNETMMLLERHFDAAFAAPDGIKKLRELILTLAMQGKLVPQDPNDEPASELLKSIKLEKQRLVKEGRIKHPKPLLDSNPTVTPYELPKKWEWANLQDLFALVTDGDHLAPPKAEVGIPFLVIGNLNKGKVTLENCRFVPHSYYQLLDWGRKPATNDILYTVTGSYGIPIFIDGDLEFCVQRHVAIFKSTKSSPVEYLMHVLKSMYAFRYATLIATGIAQKTVPLTGLRKMPIAVPPVNEQHRIVAEIDRLMARCDELEKLRADRSQKLLTVHTAALDALLKAKDSSDFSTAWHFITQNFSELYSVKENVAELRKTILQLAVMGKLVPQDPNDEPASELLKAIELEKLRLVKEGKIKQPKPLLEIQQEEMPYEVPKGWQWVRLGELALLSDSGWSPQCLSESRSGQEWGVLKVSAVSWGEFRPEENKALPQGMQPKLECEVQVGDFLISRANTEELVARSVVVKTSPVHLMMSDKIVRFNLSQKVEKDFINFANLSRFAREYYARNASGTSSSMKNISREVINNLPILLPPIIEQHRIVAEIDRLMTLCDRLEESIEAAKSKQTDLLNALMSQV